MKTKEEQIYNRLGSQRKVEEVYGGNLTTNVATLKKHPW
jgi:hypothetical protein